MRSFILRFVSGLLAFVMPCMATDLQQLEEWLAWELEAINFPGEQWLPPLSQDAPNETLDVAIVGGGMGGLAATYALMKEGITNIRVFDDNAEGQEGPWPSYARMKQLRSGKNDMGPAFWVPCLTFKAWYEIKFGLEAWESLKMAPTVVWMDYLRWYRSVMKFPIINGMKLMAIDPVDGLIRMTFLRGSEQEVVWARKVVLATGRMGFGGPEIPEWAQGLPKSCYAHTTEQIDFSALTGKRVVVVGVGASGFDAAGVALEHGATAVHMLTRRAAINAVNKFGAVVVPGFIQGFYSLPDQERWDFMSYARDNGIPPPREAVLRVQNYKNLSLHMNVRVESVRQNGVGIELVTNQGSLTADYLILACGFDFDGTKRPELAGFFDEILLWEDRVPPGTCELCPRLGRAPYLGAHFQFLERNPGRAPFLKHLYCFNYGASISHGLLTVDVEGMSVSAARLGEGIAGDFFLENRDYFYDKLLEFDKPTFDEMDLAPIRVEEVESGIA